MPGWAQERFIVTPNRGGAEGARQTIQLQQETNRGIAQQVSITALETDVSAVSTTASSAVSQVSSLRAAVNVSLSSAGDVTCGNAGMLLGPSHTMAINGCIPSLTIAPSGRVVLTQGLKIGSEGNCDASGAGTLRYEAAQRLVQFCDGTAWQEVGAAPTASGPFTAVTGANPSTVITSNAVTVTGFAGARTATATGGATIMVNGVAVGSTANVNPGDSVALRVTSSGSFDTAVNVGFSVTSISANWSVTTRSQDTTPNAFSFANLTDQAVSTTVMSDVLTVAGFDGPLTVSISGQGSPQIQIAAGSWVSSGSINPGQTLRARLTTSSSWSTAQAATVTAGTYNTGWSVTTRSQDTTPNAFSFTNLTNQAVSTTILSNVVTVGGFDGPLSVSVSGQGSPQIQIAGGSWAASGSISPGQTLRVRLTTSSSSNTAHGASVSLGTFSTNWTATTIILCQYPFQGGCATVPNPTVGSLIVAANDAGVVVWGTVASGSWAAYRGVTDMASGAANTAILASFGPGAHPAASLCANLVLNGYDDWYLPAANELAEIWPAAGIIGGFCWSCLYWSSTETDSTSAKSHYFYGNFGINDYWPKNKADPVRCVRRAN